MGIIVDYGSIQPPKGKIMLKFKFNYQNNTLAYQKDHLWHQIAAEQQFQGNFDSQGFKLDTGWITFPSIS